MAVCAHPRRFARRVARISQRPAGGWEIHFAALERAERGEDVILLSIGDHDFPTPQAVVEAAKAALDRGRHHYTPAAGIPELRAAVADFYRRVTRVAVDPAEVVLHTGAQGALYAVLQCLVEPGDQVLVPEPMYVTYPETVAATGAELLPVPLSRSAGFRLDPEAVQERIGPATRALLLNTPHNPTGTVVDRSTLEALAELCQAHGLWLVSDEVYAGMVYGGGHVSALTLRSRFERVVVIESLSKGCAMTGWRVGWTVTPRDLARHLELLAGVTTYGLPPFIQDAAVEALRHLERLEGEIAERYQRRAQRFAAALREQTGLGVLEPRAGMFLILDLHDLGLDGDRFARDLLDEQGVSVLPGSSFGPSMRHCVRVSLAASTERLLEAARRIRKHLAHHAG